MDNVLYIFSVVLPRKMSMNPIHIKNSMNWIIYKVISSTNMVEIHLTILRQLAGFHFVMSENFLTMLIIYLFLS